MSECRFTSVTNQWSSESNQSEEEQFMFGTLNNDHPVSKYSKYLPLPLYSQYQSQKIYPTQNICFARSSSGTP